MSKVPVPKCRLCGGALSAFHKTTILKTYACHFLKCSQCQIVQADDIAWQLDKEADHAVSAADTGIIVRNENFRLRAVALLRAMKQCNSRIVDYGGGYGLQTRMMRDAGFKVLHHDPYSSNLFARGFEYQIGSPTEGVIMQEVLEHILDAKAIWDDIHNNIKPSFILATTLVYPKIIPDDWWYLSKETGQHVVFYSHDTFKYLAEKMGYNYQYAGGIHIISKTHILPLKVRYYMALSLCLGRKFFLPSLTLKDNVDVLRTLADSR